MYNGYNMTQHTLPMETSVLIPTKNMSRHVNETIEKSLNIYSMNSNLIVVFHHTNPKCLSC